MKKSILIHTISSFHYVIILINWVWNKDKNNYFNIFSEKALYDVPKK